MYNSLVVPLLPETKKVLLKLFDVKLEVGSWKLEVVQ